MNTHTILSALLALSAGSALAGMVYFENRDAIEDMPFFDPNFGNTILGQSLDITRGAYDQAALGETPAGSLFFMHINDISGEYIWLGTGSVTRTAESDESVLIPTPGVPGGAAFYGPADYAPGAAVGPGDRFVDGWRAIHGLTELTGAGGVLVVDEVFRVGVEFERGGGLHYGFAEFEVSSRVMGTELELSVLPVRWGYNDRPGEAAVVIPSAPGVALLMGGGLVLSRRRR